MSLTSTILGGLASYAGAGQANKANQKTAAQQQVFDREKEARATNLLTGTNQSTGTTSNLNAAGGLDTSFLPGSAQSKLNLGDIGRADKSNEATANFAPTFNTVGDAKAFNAPDIDVAKNEATSMLEQQLRRNQQIPGGGIDNTSLARSQAAGFGDLANKFRVNENATALDTYNTQNTADSDNLKALLANYTPQAPVVAGPNSAAGAIAAQTRTPTAVTDLSGALLPMAGANAIAQDTQERERAAAIARTDVARKDTNALLERILQQQNSPNKSSVPIIQPQRPEVVPNLDNGMLLTNGQIRT